MFYPFCQKKNSFNLSSKILKNNLICEMKLFAQPEEKG